MENDFKVCGKITMKLLNKRVAFISIYDSSSKASWSGTPYFMTKALSEICEKVVHVGPISSSMDGIGDLVDKFSRRLPGKKIVHKRTHFFSKQYCSIVQKKLETIHADYIFATSSITIAHLADVNTPVIYTSDATFSSMYHYYPGFENYHAVVKNQAHEIEKMAIERADLVLYPSHWAAESAITYYGVDPAKIHVVPYGANLDSWPKVDRPEKRKRSEECQLLFLGVDWKRKGGDIALQTLIELEQRYGISARLTVVGCSPPSGVDHERMDVLGYLDKNNPEQQAKLLALIENSDYLLLPTRAECYGLVFCEASAYGLPSITTNTGGVGTVVRDGVNGYILPLSASAHEYADKIQFVETHEGAYNALSKSSRRYFEENLNWQKWGDTVTGLLNSL